MRKLKFEDQINKALINREFVLHYQPILDLRTGTTAGLEALLRWNHPERGLMYPKDFIGFSEETGLIIPMGLWVLEEACRALMRFQDRFGADAGRTAAVHVDQPVVAPVLRHRPGAQHLDDHRRNRREPGTDQARRSRKAC